MARVMEITTPLGADVLLFRSMQAREELSRVSEFQVELLSEKGGIGLNDILGKNVTIALEMPDGGTRHFNGYVTRFSQGGTYGRYFRYSVVVRPWLWFLSRTADCRIFQELSVPEIVQQVFADHGVADFKLELTQSYGKWTYCVQYRETDLNFVSRLLEQEGIYFYFRHTDGHNTLVLTDASSTHAPAPGYDELRYISPDRLVRPETEHVSGWDVAREIHPGVYAHDDYDLERPSVDLLTKKAAAPPRGHSLGDYEIYDYPGEYLQAADGTEYAGIRIDELGTQVEMMHGTSDARGVTVGALFTLDGHPRADQNREYLVVAATYELEFGEYEGMERPSGARYSCRFVAMPSQQQFRARRVTAKPFVQGPQTAVVVGPKGEEIYTDEYGRVKVQFHWDRYGKKDQNSSCWIRVSHPWAGKNWGGISLPRIGQEVIVDFLEGDPDQPIITGRVYNAEQMPPYDLPANKTQSGMKSRSSLGGTPANFNEIRFEDKKGVEQLFIHAELDQAIEVENDETHWVGHDRHKTIDHDETTHVKHDRTETVDNNETITIGVNRTEDVGAEETISIGGNRTITVNQSETATVALQRTHTVGINETITVGAAQEVTVGALQAITVGASQVTNIGVNQSLDVGGGRSAQIGKDDALKVGKNLMIDAGDAVTIKTGSASITMKKDGTITIKGKDITIEGSGKINVKASSDVVIKGSKIGMN